MATKRGTRAKADRVLSDPLERQVVTIELLAKTVIVRESDASDLVLFENMAFKSISMLVPKVPELVELLEDPLGPIFEPEKYGAVTEKRKGSKSVQFVFADILFIYHLGSAAMVNEDEDINFFTSVLLEALRTHSIKEVYAFAVNRLARDEENGADLGKLFFSRDIKIFTEGQDFDFAQPYGMMLWNLAVSMAAQDRNGIVERNRLGRIAVARRNQWPHGPKAIPLGYRLHEKSLIPVEKERDDVRKILEMMGDPEMSTRQFVEGLGMMKVTRPGVKERYGEHATVAVVRHPKDLYQSFVNMLALYETGVYEMPLPNPIKGSKVFGGLPVHGSESTDPKDYGFVVLRYHFGLPEGGWAPPEIFEAIRAKQLANRSFVNGNRERRAFGGRPTYEVDGVAYQFESSGMAKYRLCRLEGTNLLRPGTTRPGEPRGHSVTAKESLATVDVTELHRNVVMTIIDTLVNVGASGEVRTSSLHVEADPATKLRLSIDFHRRRADRAREEALRTDDGATATAFRRDVEIEEQAIADLLVAASPKRVEPVVADIVRVDVGHFVAMLAKVVKSDLKVPGAVVTAVQRLIPDLRFFPLDERGFLGWTATVRLPTEGGDVFELGPISGRVACNVVHRSTRIDGSIDTKALVLYAQGCSLYEIAERLGVGHETAWHRVRAGLAEQGIPDAALSRLRGARVRELRMLFGLIALKKAGERVTQAVDDPAVLAKLLEVGGLVPDGAESAWAAGTLVLYYGNLSVRGVWSTKDVMGQVAVDFVAAQGGSCTVASLLERIGPLENNVGTALARVLGRYNKCPPAVLRTERDLSVGQGYRLNRDEMVYLVECPHCGAGLTTVLRVTEISRHLLCVNCRRAPTAAYVFPDGYFDMDVDAGSGDGATAKSRTVAKRAAKSIPRELGVGEVKKIIADYENSEIPIGGKEGVLARNGIKLEDLYRINRENGVTPRQPYRKRKRG